MKGKALARLCCVFNAEPTFLKPSSIGFLFSGEAAWGVLHALQTPPPAIVACIPAGTLGLAPALLLVSSVTLGWLLAFSLPWVPHLYNRDINSTYLTGLL